ncbi:MAG TPA: hypothetical protein VNT79_01520, partial [Phycisphaerae bacterium]|nr:hypothetical protein [Phycisphaerae bacterium]
KTAIERKIGAILDSGLQEGQTDLETLPDGKVCGHVISSEFDGLSYQDRYKRVNELLDKSLSPKERLRVGTLLTYTPAEWAFEPEEA